VWVRAVAAALLRPGFGADMALNSVLLAAMSDVALKQSGFASGLASTVFMMGSAPGLAVLASLAASLSARLETTGDSHLAALTGGCHLAFLTGALAAATMAGLLVRTRNTAARSDTGSSALATTESY
jgi:hypothetical protein